MKAITVLIAHLFFMVITQDARADEIHVRPDGPMHTLAEAQRVARKTKAPVIIHAGTYYLPETLVFTEEDAGTEYRAADGDTVVISGAMRLELDWERGKEGVMYAKTPPGLVMDQLLINGKLQRLARYPNFNPEAVKPKRTGGGNGDPDAPKFNGASGTSTTPERVAQWANPEGGYLHAIQGALWGSLHYRILGKNSDGTLNLEGGWQHNRPDKGAHKDFRFVENIFEELDAPEEWFHNTKTNILYYIPSADTDLKTAKVESVRLQHLIEFAGTKERPVKSVSLRGLKFTAAGRTFMENKESLLRSDWTIYRGGAVFFHGAEDCSIEDCDFDQLGGNAVFISGYNRRVSVRGCLIQECGANGVAVVGEAKSVRSPMFSWGPGNPWSGGKPQLDATEIDRVPGPLSEDYPADCLIDDCLITRIGRLEKQSACVEIDIAKDITVRHCSIYEVPRAGVNIGDGCWGGHVVENCDVFDTVFETGDHGSFNSWGRDRYWGGTPRIMKQIAATAPELKFADAIKPIQLRNNRWKCDYGFSVDLDDGSSNYEIYNNLMLGGGLKLREGFHRIVRNNIIVNNSMHPHCWYENSGDVFTQNIVMRSYQPSHVEPVKWGEEIDRNLFTTSENDRKKFVENGCDTNSLVGDPLFVDPSKGDYRVQDGSPALALGFRNFPMDEFGVRSPRLKALARNPVFPKLDLRADTKVAAKALYSWRGAKIRELEEMEFSALQVPENATGIIIVEAPMSSVAYQAGLRKGDYIQSIDEKLLRTVKEFSAIAEDKNKRQTRKLSIRREQHAIYIELSPSD